MDAKNGPSKLVCSCPKDTLFFLFECNEIKRLCCQLDEVLNHHGFKSLSVSVKPYPDGLGLDGSD